MGKLASVMNFTGLGFFGLVDFALASVAPDDPTTIANRQTLKIAIEKEGCVVFCPLTRSERIARGFIQLGCSVIVIIAVITALAAKKAHELDKTPYWNIKTSVAVISAVLFSIPFSIAFIKYGSRVLQLKPPTGTAMPVAGQDPTAANFIIAVMALIIYTLIATTMWATSAARCPKPPPCPSDGST